MLILANMLMNLYNLHSLMHSYNYEHLHSLHTYNAISCTRKFDTSLYIWMKLARLTFLENIMLFIINGDGLSCVIAWNSILTLLVTKSKTHNQQDW